jgi:hypothetical protein
MAHVLSLTMLQLQLGLLPLGLHLAQARLQHLLTGSAHATVLSMAARACTKDGLIGRPLPQAGGSGDDTHRNSLAVLIDVAPQACLGVVACSAGRHTVRRACQQGEGWAGLDTAGCGMRPQQACFL